MRAGAVAAAACLAAALAGCGGSGGSGGDGRWGQRADVICDRAEQAIRTLGEPEDTADLARVLARTSGEVRVATAKIRELDAAEDERRRAKPFLADLALVERSLDRLARAAADGRRGPIEKAGRSLRLDAVDIAAHAEEAGLTRCGREEIGVAAADAVLTPSFAAFVANQHSAFMVAERRVARRYDPKGSGRERDRYWVALWAVLERADGEAEGPEGELPAMREYWNAGRELRDATDFLSSIARGETPITSEHFSEARGRRLLRAYMAAGFTLLGELGPARVPPRLASLAAHSALPSRRARASLPRAWSSGRAWLACSWAVRRTGRAGRPGSRPAGPRRGA